MNNNRNNRRRGRGNRNQGGGNQANRIDSRARGNAPQLLDKYKKLAQDAQHNGDRVQAEYYLQFADHYFRVLADNRARQEEQRARREERDSDDNDGEDDDEGEDRRRHSNRRGRSRSDGRDDRQDPGMRSGHEGDAPDADDNPFTRSDQAEKPRKRVGRPRRAQAKDDGSADNGIDAAAVPPAIGANDRDSEAKEEKPASAPRRRRKPADDEGPLSAVG